MRHPRKALAAAALVALGGLACAGRGGVPARATWEPPAAALYKVRLEGGADEKTRKFRLLLFAELPDRLHGEVLSPLGRTELIADAGDGRISIFFVRDRIAFSGAVEPRVIEDLLGIKLSLEELVAGLLTGEVANRDVELQRFPESGSGLPERLEIRVEARSLVMQLKRRQELRVDPAELGTGVPPPGAEVRPLESLDAGELPGVEVEEAS